jgi:uncharacterized phage protein gp47/JayE
MPAPYGVTDAGFSRKTLTEAQDEWIAKFRASFGASINVNPESRFGTLIGIFAEREASIWEVLEAIYNAQFPDSASGVSLDNVMGITGTIRRTATKSTATVTATGTPTTLLPAGRVFQVQNGGAKFQTLADATIAALTAWVATTAYTLGQRRTNSGQVYEVTTPGTSAGAGGPTGTGAAITDGTVVWKWLGAGTGAVDIAVEAQATGPNAAPAGTMTVIVTAVAGLNTVVNELDAVVGRALETDAEARVRREAELRLSGNAAIDAIRAAILELDGVTEATIFDNPTMITDVNGLPPKSVEALISGGADAEIRTTLLESVAAGIETYGTTSGIATDDQGTNHTIKFTRPTPVNVWVRVDVKVTDQFPTDGATQIRNAIVAYWNGVKRAGKNVVPSQISAQAQAVAGVDEVTLVYLGLADPPVSGATLLIDLRSIAALDTSRIYVNSTATVP